MNQPIEIPYIVGVLNLSPESFNNKTDVGRLLECANQMVTDGADILDIGAQSSRPGIPQLSVGEEIVRLVGAIATLKREFPTVPISVDTTRSEVIRIALREGVELINDISGGRFDENLLREVARSGARYVLMHSQGTFDDMHKLYKYTDIVSEIKDYFRKRIDMCVVAGIQRQKIILDPGIGFSKSGEQNLEILRRLNEFRELKLPLYIGLSRKRFVGSIINEEKSELRDNATTVLHTYCIQHGVEYIRTHNVKYLSEAVQVLEKLSS